jgi:hypothetical protein
VGVFGVLPIPLTRFPCQRVYAISIADALFLQLNPIKNSLSDASHLYQPVVTAKRIVNVVIQSRHRRLHRLPRRACSAIGGNAS